MEEHEMSSLGEQIKSRAESEPLGFSRRRFIGAGGVAAVAFAAGSVGFEPLVNPSSSAEAAQEVGPLLGLGRINTAHQHRIDQAIRMANVGAPGHPNNGDEDNLPGFIGNYSKALPHNAAGEVDPTAYNRLLTSLATGAQADFDNILLGGRRKLTNPQSGLAFDMEGNDPHQFVQPPAPSFSSAEEAAEMVELYWMALLRDVPFLRYDSEPLAAAAVNELNHLSDFRGPKQGGRVTIETLFRDVLPGTAVGPYMSQFWYLTTPFGSEIIDRRSRVLAAGSDHMTGFEEWLAVQNGNVPGSQQFDTKRRYLTNGRDLGAWVHVDVLFQAYFEACLILAAHVDEGGLGAPLNPGNPYIRSLVEDGFGTLGGPFFKTILAEVSTRALKAVWFQKWFVHRRLRPEELGGRIHVHKTGQRSYPIHGDVLSSEALDRIKHKTGSYLLPMTFPEGSPTHPSYGAGHATVAGACVTILKALFDESFAIPNPVVPNPSGANTQAYIGAPLTVLSELHKIASNVATGRNFSGVHWRTDAYWSLRLGERVAACLLQDTLTTLNEDVSSGLSFTGFNGQTVTVTPTSITGL
jgi:hypothetical protein